MKRKLLAINHIFRYNFSKFVMDKISQVVVRPLEKGSKFVIPVRVDYHQDGKKKTWEAVRAGKSVSCVIYNRTRDKLICVKQFRPGVFINSADESNWIKDDEGKFDTASNPACLGVTLEFCGGLVDKPLAIEQICAEEVLEETGYLVSACDVVKVGTCHCAVGIAGEPLTMYYAEVSDDMRKGPGGGIDDEMIEVVELSVDEARKIMCGGELVAPPEFFWGLTWFLMNKAK